MPDEALDWLIAEEIESLQEHYEQVGAGEVEPAIDPEFDDERAEMHLRCLKYHTAEFDRLKALYQTEMDKLALKFQTVTKSLQGSILYHTQNLVAFGKSRGETYKGLNGKVKRTQGRDSVVCDEPEEKQKFYAWCQETGNLERLTRVKPEEWFPDKKAIHQYIKTTSELPPGVDIKTGEDSYKIEY